MSFSRVLAAALAAAAFLSAALPLSASTWRGEALLREVQLAPWTLGPFRLQPQIILSDLCYDSNIYHQPEAVGDYSFTAGPRINAYLALKKKIVFTLSESPATSTLPAAPGAPGPTFTPAGPPFSSTGFSSRPAPTPTTPASAGATRSTSARGSRTPDTTPSSSGSRRGKRPSPSGSNKAASVMKSSATNPFASPSG